MNNTNHSVELVSVKCIGCTDCIKRCPTEAIRVRDGKAVITAERCIDCGMCIKICRSHAKRAVTDKLNIINNFKYKIAIPAPTLYGQFKNVTDTNVILTALKNLGFDEIFEVAHAAELVTAATKKFIKNNNLKRPIISSACPVTIRLISKKFPSLLGNILPIIAPMEIAAIAAKKHTIKQLGLKYEDIGVFFISPCSAKVTNAKNPLGIEKSEVDGVISMQDIYMQLNNNIKNLTKIEVLAQGTEKGIDWALTGGESKGIDLEEAIAVDGIENVIKVFEDVENGQLDVDFIECLSCTGGCVGGSLTVLNNFVAKNNLRKLERFMRNSKELNVRKIKIDIPEIDFYFTNSIEALNIEKLDSDMAEAIRKMEQIEKLHKILPKINCGSCGAPTCMALAEDIVQGKANIEDCIFMLRERVRDLAEVMVSLAAKMPQTISDYAKNEERLK